MAANELLTQYRHSSLSPIYPLTLIKQTLTELHITLFLVVYSPPRRGQQYPSCLSRCSSPLPPSRRARVSTEPRRHTTRRPPAAAATVGWASPSPTRTAGGDVVQFC